MEQCWRVSVSRVRGRVVTRVMLWSQSWPGHQTANIHTYTLTLTCTVLAVSISNQGTETSQISRKQTRSYFHFLFPSDISRQIIILFDQLTISQLFNSVKVKTVKYKLLEHCPIVIHVILSQCYIRPEAGVVLVACARDNKEIIAVVVTIIQQQTVKLDQKWKPGA